MKELKDIRIEINKIDSQMRDLFSQRMELSKQVAEYKKSLGLQILDSEREQQVINNNANAITNDEIKPFYVDFLKSVMKVSRDYQRVLNIGMKVAYSGVPGAYAYIAGKRLFPDAELISVPNFAAAYESVVNGESDVCVLPIENSYAGDVGLVNDLMFKGNLFLTDVYDLEILHNLLVKPGTKLENIKKVISHQQALSQCHSFIEKNNLLVQDYPNTAMAAKFLSESDDATIGVIASAEVAELYGLEIIKENINDSRLNTTRFGVFSKAMSTPRQSKSGDHFILMFTVANQAGSLATTLNIIGSHGFNMRTLRSRPLKELLWSYYFLAELDGDISSRDAKEMLQELETVCDNLKVAGAYYSQARK
ncbi:MAG: chorismate mutase [Bacilli bacterium]|nr:chorismate mutase [Bacilli bacterium]